MNQLRTISTSPVKASSMIGTKVVSTQGESLGEINEVVVDPMTAEVAYVVVSFGGFLSVGAKLFAIPYSAFKYNVAKSSLVENEYILEVSRDHLEKAPGFDADHWPMMNDEKWQRELHTYYGRLPYWE